MESLSFDNPRNLMLQSPDLIMSYNHGGNIPDFTLCGAGLIDFSPINSSSVAAYLCNVEGSFSAFLNFGLYDINEDLNGNRLDYPSPDFPLSGTWTVTKRYFPQSKCLFKVGGPYIGMLKPIRQMRGNLI